MKISVIIPVYNAASTIEAAVQSVLVQKHQDLEVVLVNDGSSDGSAGVCDHLAESYDNVCVIHKPNGGVSSARNAGIDAASGDFIMFLDADDLLKPDALERMSAYDADLVLAGFEKTVNGTVTESVKPASDESYSGNAGICDFFDQVIGDKDCFLLNSSCFKLYRSSLIRKHGLRFDCGLRYGEDKVFVFGYLRYVTSAVTVSHVVYDYVIQADSLSSDVTSDSHVSQILRLLERYTVLLDELGKSFGESKKLRSLYHVDVVSRYVCRILTCFMLGKSSHMTYDTLSLLYGYMSRDPELSVFSVRLGQILNILLYKSGNVAFSMKVYSIISSVSTYIRRR